MNKAVVAALGLSLLLAAQANADFVYPTQAGPFNVVAGTGFTLALNDAANGAAVTAGTYRFWTVSADWVAGGGTPWSSESRVTMNWAAGNSNGPLLPMSGEANDGNPTTLSFFGGLSPNYVPAGNATMDLFLDQTFVGSNAMWSNINVTLINNVAAPPTLDTLDLSGFGSDTSNGAHAANTVSWFEILHPGGTVNVNTNGSDFDTELALYDAMGFFVASDDEGGTGLQSSLTLGLSSGTYFAAVSGFDTAFFEGFNVNPGAFGGNFVITADAIPEPTTIPALIACLVMLLALQRRSIRRPVSAY